MATRNADNRRLAKNTLALYLRTFITMIVSLFTVRVIFNVLGAEDYGIRNVVAGFVLMFSFITGSLSVAISRFMAIELGKNNEKQITNIFSASLVIVVAVALLLALLIEAFGIYFLNNEMTIPPNRLYAANWVLQFSVITLAFNMISVPYDALIVSYERMSAYAYVSIVDVMLKLGIAYLTAISSIDKLIAYSFLLMVEALAIRILYGIYCNRQFATCKYTNKLEPGLIKRIFTLSAWDLWGSSSYVLKNYGVNVLINLFFNPVVNASRGIALQVNTAVSSFSGGFLTAIRPQITKCYAEEDRERLTLLIDNGTRFAVYLMWIVALPIITECNYIIGLWLGETPPYCVVFVDLVLILSIYEGSMVYCHNAALMATGKIVRVQFITGTLQLLNIPLSYLLLWSGCSPESTIWLAIVIANLCCFIRVFFLQSYIHYSATNFILKVYFRFLIIAALSFTMPAIIRQLLPEGLIRLIVNTLVCALWSIFIVLYVGCSRSERTYCFEIIKRRIYRK